MKIEIKIPNVGESVKEAILAEWYKQDCMRTSENLWKMLAGRGL